MDWCPFFLSRHLQSRIVLCSILRCFQASSIHRRSAQMWVWHCWPKQTTHGLISLMFTWSKLSGWSSLLSHTQKVCKKLRPTNQQTYSRAISKAFVMMVFTPRPKVNAVSWPIFPAFKVLALQDFWFERHRITWQSSMKSWGFDPKKKVGKRTNTALNVLNGPSTSRFFGRHDE